MNSPQCALTEAHISECQTWSTNVWRSTPAVHLPLLLITLACLAGCGEQHIDLRSGNSSSSPPLVSTTVGMPVALNDLILPGGELESIPQRNSDETELPVVVRIVQAIPHGDDFRYSFEVYALQPGEFDLGDYLRPIAGGELRDLPAINFKVTSLLPAGQIEPNELVAGKLPRLGGYRRLLLVASILWLGGLLILLFGWRRKLRASRSQESHQPTLADRLRPIVVSAMQGNLTSQEQSQLERLLLAYWKQRLGVSDLSPAKAMAAVRADDEAGELVRQLEDWLHRPDPPESVDIEALLLPYKDLGADRDLMPTTTV